MSNGNNSTDPKKWIIVGAVVVVLGLVGWLIYIEVTKPKPQPDSAIRGLFKDTPEDEVFIQMFAEPGYVPGTVFRRKGRMIVVNPATIQAPATITSESPMRIQIREPRSLATDMALTNALISASGTLKSGSTVEFSCDEITFQNASQDELSRVVKESQEKLRELIDDTAWHDDPPMIVYKAAVGKYNLNVKTLFDEGTEVDVARKKNPVFEGQVTRKTKTEADLTFTAEKPVVFAFCARVIRKDFRMSAPGQEEVAVNAKTDNTSAWESAPFPVEYLKTRRGK